LALAPCTLHLNKGFTLLELIVVLFIVVLGFSVVGINLSSGNDSTQLKVAARDIVSALRYARDRLYFLISKRQLPLTYRKQLHCEWSRQGLYYPKTIDVTVVTAQSELTGKGLGISFFCRRSLQAAELLWSGAGLPGKSI